MVRMENIKRGWERERENEIWWEKSSGTEVVQQSIHSIVNSRTTVITLTNTKTNGYYEMGIFNGCLQFFCLPHSFNRSLFYWRFFSLKSGRNRTRIFVTKSHIHTSHSNCEQVCVCVCVLCMLLMVVLLFFIANCYSFVFASSTLYRIIMLRMVLWFSFFGISQRVTVFFLVFKSFLLPCWLV